MQRRQKFEDIYSISDLIINKNRLCKKVSAVHYPVAYRIKPYIKRIKPVKHQKCRFRVIGHSFSLLQMRSIFCNELNHSPVTNPINTPMCYPRLLPGWSISRQLNDFKLKRRASAINDKNFHLSSL